MAELSFFLSLEERNRFLYYCLDNDFIIIPDKNYRSNTYDFIENLEQYSLYNNDYVGCFILCKNGTKHPFEMDVLKNNDGDKYFIKHRYGGPSVNFYTPIFAEKKYNKIGPGSIHIYPFYYQGNDIFTPDNTFNISYKTLVSQIKQMSTKVKVGKRIYWVGNFAIEQFKKGNLDFVEMEGVNWKDFEIFD